ncbi:hypothetical protein [Moorena sp. SIO4G3]|uniref:hypothetical protein n=1 Tax=Moorena sp. SIO4G3 TaxID=2607821 RepID=UPI00142AD235|nr:hypothetical protein [Moorena sp. SIO4G3]NEO82589.1 hypothetical protein [Moorena sp. SIO4G3]
MFLWNRFAIALVFPLSEGNRINADLNHAAFILNKANLTINLGSDLSSYITNKHRLPRIKESQGMGYLEISTV